jgi:sugar lactone lactonase YvrE
VSGDGPTTTSDPISTLPPDITGTVQWGARIAGTGTEVANSLSVDGSGNVYVTGDYNSNPLTLYNSDGSAFATTLPNSGLQDCFVTKYNTSGTIQWGARIAGTGSEEGVGVSVDGSGNVYVTGRYDSNPVTLYNSDGSAFATTLANSGNYDCFVAKYNTSGSVQWGARIAGTGGDRGYAISVDGSGNLYVTGSYGSNPLTLYNSDGSEFATTLPYSGSIDCFVAKYNTSGTVQWGARIAGTGSEEGYAISVDSSGNVYVTGYYTSNPVTLYNSDGSAFATTLPNSEELQDCFVAKYNTSGTVQWGARIAGTGSKEGRSLSVDSSGNVYVTGIYSSSPLTLYNSDGSEFATTLPNSGLQDCFVAKYNTSGSVQWGARIAGTGNDRGYAISVDSSGNLYVTGYYRSNPVTLYNSDGSEFATTLPNSGLQDCFVAKYNTSGSVQWGVRIAGSNFEGGYGISVDGLGNLYVTGFYDSNPLTFYNSDGSAFATTLTNSGNFDCFVVKYG